MHSKDDLPIRLLDSSGRAIREVFGDDSSKSEDRHILDVTEQLILDAIEDEASDILIDPQNNASYTVRFRIDGMLETTDEIDAQTGQAVINSIKAVSSMDISERRRPQDGAFTARMPDATAAFRVASAGVINGEKLSIRVLNQNASEFSLDNIGLTQKQRKVVQGMIKKPSGMILICGPTGSGKTTSLYAMLNEIDLYTRNVITVEDPIECVLENCSQIEVNPKADITFAQSLRGILRQDPDIICVGEVRDEETAGIALRAAQTGHLVLATIHSDTNASALVRLIDLGVSPLLLAAGLNLIVSQRLIRKLCNDCKMPAQLTESKIREFQRKGINCRNFHQPQGCRNCRDTGYYGRVGIYDLLILDKQLKTNIAEGELTVAGLKNQGEQKGKSNLRKQGLKLVVTGITSMEELNRVVG
jgi:type II secretory ATPase GspE/PulE/Tfp pilus assembly ATPase PilB-like protein